MKKLLAIIVILETLILVNFVLKDTLHASKSVKTHQVVVKHNEVGSAHKINELKNSAEKHLLTNQLFKDLLFTFILFLSVLVVLNAFTAYYKLKNSMRILLNIVVSLTFIILFKKQFLILLKSYPFIIPFVISVFILSQIFYTKKQEQSLLNINVKMPSEFIEQYKISKRESEIISLILKEMSNEEIGKKLFISLSTVKNHIHNIFQKTGVKKRREIVHLLNA